MNARQAERYTILVVGLIAGESLRPCSSRRS
jgi:hypothetical protein